MQTQVNKKIDYSGQQLYVGLDVHQKSWQVSVLSDTICLKTFTQPPDPVLLYEFLSTHYPNAKYMSAYEAGFSGYSHHRKLLELGINNIVINPADIPRSNKDVHYKTDKRDSRIIAEALRSGLLKGIYVFDPKSEEFRGLFRSRLALAKDIRKSRNRIKSFLAYRNIEIPKEFLNNYRSQAYMKWLYNLQFKYSNAHLNLNILIDKITYLDNQRKKIEKELRRMVRQRDRELYILLLTIPGIGPITAIGIMAEIGDISRFKHIKQFASYVGVIPRIHQSGDKERVGSITYRHNSYLRPLIVESSWQAVRADPVMLKYYQEKCKTSNAKKAIIKVSRKLLNRIMYVMKNRKQYQRGIN